MSHEIVKKYYDYFNEQNWDGMISCLTPDVQHDVNEGDKEIGPEKFRKFILSMDDHYDEKISELCLMTNKGGDRVAAEFTITGIYKKTSAGLPPAKGQKYRLSVGAFFEVKKGLIARVTNYYNLKKWIQMVQT